MKYHYDVMFGTNGVDRDCESFTTLNKATKFANQKVEEGKAKVFLDTFDEYEDLVDYKQFN